MDHLTIQIDAPINSGNSGGPAFDEEGNIVGIAIQTISNADGIGYLVPVEVIQHFFNDIKDGVYDGYPGDGIWIQNLQNKNIKSFYKMGNREGVLVTKTTQNGSANGHIKKGDVILEVDGIDIAGDNTIRLKENGRVSSNYLVRSHQVGDMLKVKILRDTKEMDVTFPLKMTKGIIPHEHEKAPRYYIFGGMVFMPLSINYLKVWGTDWFSTAPLNLMYPVLNQEKIDKEIQELVILSNILPNNENANYRLSRDVVQEVNGKKVISLDSFVKIISESKNQYINILLDSGKKFVLDKEKALKSDIETMKKYGITRKQRL